MKYEAPKVKPTTSFGEWLDRQMCINNLSTREVAEKLHCGSVTISYHRNGKRRPTFSDVVAYCWAFDCTDDPEKIWGMIDILIEEN